MLIVYLNDDLFQNISRQFEGQMKNLILFRYIILIDVYIYIYICQSLIVEFFFNSQKINVIYIYVKDGLSVDVFVCE